MVVFAGHQGGNLTHGSKYLLRNAPDFVKAYWATPGDAARRIDEPEKYYLREIMPEADRFEEARDVLRYVVDNGTRAEAIAATRALCGFKVANLGAFPDPDERRRISHTCEPASGRAFFWVPRADA